MLDVCEDLGDVKWFDVGGNEWLLDGMNVVVGVDLGVDE